VYLESPGAEADRPGSGVALDNHAGVCIPAGAEDPVACVGVAGLEVGQDGDQARVRHVTAVDHATPGEAARSRGRVAELAREPLDLMRVRH